MGEMVEFDVAGNKQSGYLAIPSGGKGKGLLVIQEWWGLVPHIKAVADRFSSIGFTAFAPDLYHGRVAHEPNEAQKEMMALQLDSAGAELSNAVGWLLESGHVTGDAVGAVGFCMGGGLVIHLAAVDPRVAAAVPYYGVGPGAAADLSAAKAAFLGHWAANDHSTPKETVDALQAKLKDLGLSADFYWYEGCDHAFFNDDRPEVYNRDAAELSFNRTVDFLNRVLS